MISRRMMMIDCIAVGHGPDKIPPAFFAYASHVIIFNTIPSMKKRADELGDVARWEEIQSRVKQKAFTDPYYYEIHKI
jgi:hypothetical protein